MAVSGRGAPPVAYWKAIPKAWSNTCARQTNWAATWPQWQHA